jgi:hypothetical protein
MIYYTSLNAKQLTAVSQVEEATRNQTTGSTTYDSKGRERVNTAP